MYNVDKVIYFISETFLDLLSLETSIMSSAESTFPFEWSAVDVWQIMAMKKGKRYLGH